MSRPPSYVMEDGRWYHRFRQSWLNNYLGKCPEQARRERELTLPKWDTDAACLGTAVHEAIEVVIDDVVQHGTPLPLGNAIGVFERKLMALSELPTWKWTKYKNLTPLLTRGRIAVELFYAEVLPDLNPLKTEHRFRLPFIDNDERVVELSGTIDYINVGPRILDWKTTERKYEEWEYKRWAVQPTMYTWAWETEYGDVPTFEYVVFVKDAVQRFVVERDASHYDWMTEQIHQACEQIEAGLSRWTLGDQGWWCSPQWCPAFDECKGALMPVGWPKAK